MPTFNHARVDIGPAVAKERVEEGEEGSERSRRHNAFEMLIAEGLVLEEKLTEDGVSLCASIRRGGNL